MTTFGLIYPPSYYVMICLAFLVSGIYTDKNHHKYQNQIQYSNRINCIYILCLVMSSCDHSAVL